MRDSINNLFYIFKIIYIVDTLCATKRKITSVLKWLRRRVVCIRFQWERVRPENTMRAFVTEQMGPTRPGFRSLNFHWQDFMYNVVLQRNLKYFSQTLLEKERLFKYRFMNINNNLDQRNVLTLCFLMVTVLLLYFLQIH